MDTDSAPLDDPMVRRAMAMAVDRQKLIDDLYDGNLEIANGILPPGIPGHFENLRGISFDPEEARKLLAESRYAGNLPEMAYLTVDWGGDPPETVQFLVASWRENLGIEVNITAVDPDAYYSGTEDSEGHFLSFGWVADYPDPQNFLDVLLHSESHHSRYTNEAFDALIEQARVTQDSTARLELYHLAEQLLMDDTGIIPLFHVQAHVLLQPYVEAFAMSPTGQPDISNVQFSGGP